jgi:hypothetical protein
MRMRALGLIDVVTPFRGAIESVGFNLGWATLHQSNMIETYAAPYQRLT